MKTKENMKGQKVQKMQLWIDETSSRTIEEVDRQFGPDRQKGRLDIPNNSHDLSIATR